MIHALDRVLLNGHYGIPNWFFGKYRVAYWNKFKKPPEQPKYASIKNRPQIIPDQKV